MDEELVTARRVTKYAPEVAAGIGRLMPFLNDKLPDAPMAEEVLREIIDSPHHVQIVAYAGNLIVGAATVSRVMGPAVVHEAHLSDFVTDPAFRNRGIGNMVWDEVIRWCQEKGIDNLSFTSAPSAGRSAARHFYETHDAVQRVTDVFHVAINKPPTD